jgi:predicted GNAT family acetyltransferase
MNVIHDESAHRFVASGPDGEGYLVYGVLQPAVLDFEYVEVSSRFRGTGVAGQIVQAACRHARSVGAKVVPTCPYIAWWFTQHPEERDLLLTRETRA